MRNRKSIGEELEKLCIEQSLQTILELDRKMWNAYLERQHKRLKGEPIDHYSGIWTLLNRIE